MASCRLVFPPGTKGFQHNAAESESSKSWLSDQIDQTLLRTVMLALSNVVLDWAWACHKIFREWEREFLPWEACCVLVSECTSCNESDCLNGVDVVMRNASAVRFPISL
jgi:hypothetical protein